MDRNYCLIVFIVYKCHTVIHRKFKNVVYMKKIDVKKKGEGHSETPLGYPVHKYL